MSVYIQLTERCNMRCPHCCFAATSKGRDMSLDVFIDSLHFCDDNGSMITFGGGEPTLWRHFNSGFKYLKEYMNCLDSIEHMLMITNGTRYRNTMQVIKMMEEDEEYGNDKFSVVLSDPFDGFHEPDKVNNKIYDYFIGRQNSSRNNTYPKEYMRRVKKIMAVGRGVDISNSKEGCSCEAWHIDVDGKISQCGCIDSPMIGTVQLGVHNPYSSICCYKSDEYKENIGAE